MRAVRQLVRYLGISDGNMEQGSLRCDANVSIRPIGQTERGTRVELKNINSFKFVQKALEYEAARQARVLDEGGQVQQETRLWDTDTGITRTMRTKEEANDYRYFPDPDLPPLVIDDELLDQKLPMLPGEVRKLLTEQYGLSGETVQILSAEPDRAKRAIAELEAAGRECAELTANLLRGPVLRFANERGITDWAALPMPIGEIATIAERIGDATISGSMGNQIIEIQLETGKRADDIIDERGFRQISDEGAIEEIAAALVAANPKQVEQFRAGKDKVIGFFVGQVMRETKGKANPQLVNQLLLRLLRAKDES
jgi:aspartyl-tRNA(Asn)/glutamyl-tRNA(Gln) amidotransferase subunit B